MGLTEKTKRWLKRNCDLSLKGKTVLITGANSGIGFKTAESMAFLGADVILACRNPQRAADARDALLKDYPDVSVTVMQLDLASFRSIDAFVSEIREKQTDIDVFVNNAGAFHHPGEKTAEGFDLVIGTNYIGVVSLTEQLLPYLETLPHEVVYVNTVSVITKAARKVDYSDFYCGKHPGNVAVYARSKLCLAKYTWALAQRCAGTNIRVQMSHPGIALTPLGMDAYGKHVGFLVPVLGRIPNSPEKSALSLAYILSHDLPDGSVTGPDRMLDCVGYPRQNRTARKVKEGGEELARFTENEIRKAEGHLKEKD